VPKIGAEFGGYRLESLIGHGGMSIVYRAQHLSLERTVALKLLAPQLSDDEAFRERFLRESRLAASLDHPNVIPIYEAGEEDGVFFIAMRYVEGLDLKTLLKREGSLPLDRTSSIISQVSNALGAAHAKGLVHRDVKPANILIASGYGPEESDHVYLSDFGVVKHSGSQPLTQTGMFVGTAEYASPEQIEGKELDGRADVYALGCVLYECLTGDPAYDRDSEVALMYAHLLEPPPVPHEKRPDLPAEVDDVVAKGMAKNRDDRYQSPRELAVALRQAVGAPTTSVGATELASGGETVLSPGAPEIPPTAAAPPAAAPPPAVAPAPAPAAPAPPRDGTGKRTWLIVGGIVAALLIIGGIVGAVLALTGGSSNKSSSGNTTSNAPTTLRDALLPTGVARYCKVQSTAEKGAVETDTCSSPASAPSAYPDKFTLSFYPSASARKAAYEQAKKGVRVLNCGGVSGQSKWVHQADGKTGGLVVCGIDKQTGDSTIAWSHEKLGNPTHVDMVGIALEPGRGTSMFRSWWKPVAGSTANSALGKCRPALSEAACNAIVTKFEKKKGAS
jgi:tRNA A-37 threonylcarbamoyl transferase component Bud32